MVGCRTDGSARRTRHRARGIQAAAAAVATALFRFTRLHPLLVPGPAAALGATGLLT
jgi:hypothetical protein